MQHRVSALRKKDGDLARYRLRLAQVSILQNRSVAMGMVALVLPMMEVSPQGCALFEITVKTADTLIKRLV